MGLMPCGRRIGAAGASSNNLSLIDVQTQAITFGALNNLAVGSGPVTRSATASSGLAASFPSTTSGVCTVAGNTVTLVSAGTCSTTTSQRGEESAFAASKDAGPQIRNSASDAQSRAEGKLSIPARHRSHIVCERLTAREQKSRTSPGQDVHRQSDVTCRAPTFGLIGAL